MPNPQRGQGKTPIGNRPAHRRRPRGPLPDDLKVGRKQGLSRYSRCAPHGSPQAADETAQYAGAAGPHVPPDVEQFVPSQRCPQMCHPAWRTTVAQGHRQNGRISASPNWWWVGGGGGFVHVVVDGGKGTDLLDRSELVGVRSEPVLTRVPPVWAESMDTRLPETAWPEEPPAIVGILRIGIQILNFYRFRGRMSGYASGGVGQTRFSTIRSLSPRPSFGAKSTF